MSTMSIQVATVTAERIVKELNDSYSIWTRPAALDTGVMIEVQNLNTEEYEVIYSALQRGNYASEHDVLEWRTVQSPLLTFSCLLT